MRRPSDRDRLGTCWLIGGLLLAACCFWTAFPHAGLSGTSSGATISRVSSSHTTIPIEHIRVGDRVVTELPKEARDADWSQSLAHRQTVDPSTWRLVRLRAETIWDDGTIDEINVETLQPPEWLVYHHAEVGATVPIPLDLVEMGLPEGLMAEVLSIECCPPVKDGPGRIVLTTVNHLNNYVFDLTIEDEQGQKETVGVTGFHKFYSQSRGAWVSVDELIPDEVLSGLSGKLDVVGLQWRKDTTERVYNLTVEREHIYRVSASGALVHNNNCFTDAEELVRTRGGAILVIEPGAIPTGVWSTDLPNLPGIPRTMPVQQHAFHILDDIITDSGNPAGIGIDDWLEELAALNGGPSIIDDVIFRPHLPGGSQIPTHPNTPPANHGDMRPRGG